MNTVTRHPSLGISAQVSRRGVALASLCIVCAAWLAFHNTFSVPFFFDDLTAINSNASIRRLGSLGDVL